MDFGKISFRLPAIIVLAVVSAASAIGIFAYVESSNEVRRQAVDQLVALRESRQAALGRFFESIEEDLQLFATSRQVVDAMSELHYRFGQLDMSDRFREEALLRETYPAGKVSGDRGILRAYASPARAEYFHAHGRFHDWFQSAIALKGYYDLFLIAPNGDVIYTVFKEPDFASNLLTGKWADTGLAEVFKSSLKADKGDPSSFVPFRAYAPSKDAPAAFIARTIKKDGRTIGVIALQVPSDRINKVLQVTAGMGETGETYIVGPDFKMHSDSRFSDASTILAVDVRTTTAERALKGEKGVATIDDYRGVAVVSAFQPFSFGGTNWAVLAEKDVAEVQMPIDDMRRTIILIGIGLTLMLTLGGLLLSTSITRPLARLSASIKEFRETQRPVDLSQFGRKDEIGEIASGFDQAAREVSETIRSINAAREDLKRSEQELREGQERIQSLLELSPIGFTLARLSGEVLLTNDALRRLLDLPDKVEGALDAEALYEDPEDRRRYVETLRSEKEVSGFEAVWRRRDGARLWVRISSKLIPYDGDEAILAWIDDVTLDRAAAQEIADKEALLRLSFDTMTDGIYVVDVNLNYVLFNNRYLELVDLPREITVVGQPIAEAARAHAVRGDYGPGDVEEQVSARLESLRSDSFVQTELSVDNGRRTLELRKASMDDGGAVVVLSDISARKRAEMQLAEQRAITETVLENMGRGFAFFDDDLNLLAGNDLYADIVGFPKNWRDRFTNFVDLTQFYYADMEDTVERDRLIGASIELMRARALFTGEYEIPDGRIVEIVLNPVPTGGVIRTYTDITERKKTEQEIVTQKAVLESVLESMDQGFTMFDSEHNLIAWNRKISDIMNLPDHLTRIGVNVSEWYRDASRRGEYDTSEDAFDGDDVEARIENRIESIRQGNSLTYERALGDGRFVEVRRNPVTDGGFVSTYTDVTERKKAEEAIAAQKALIEESIQYASRIQLSTLPTEHALNLAFQDNFVIWEPRDVVGGDVYWLLPLADAWLIGVADCTGHGVPGAFLTLVATSALRYALSENPEATPGQVITSMNYFIKDVLAQYTDDAISDDGLELGLCRITKDTGDVTFAGARFSLWIVDEGEVQEIKGDKTGIGYTTVPIRIDLTDHAVTKSDAAAFYMFSDGFNDQVGGERGRAYGKRRIVKQLLSLADVSMAEQREALLKSFLEYQGEEARRDDLTMVGFRI